MRKRKPVPRSDLDFGSPTGFRDQRGSYKDVAARDRARRSKNLSSKLQVQLLAQYATLKVGSNGKKEGVRDLCEEFAVDKDYVTDHLLFRGLDADRDMEHKVDARKPTIFTEDVDEFMLEQGLKWDGDFSWQEMADAVNEKFELPPNSPSGEGVRKHCIEAGWTDTKQQVLPWLTDAQVKARATWAKKNNRNKFMGWVDVRNGSTPLAPSSRRS